MHSMKLTFMSNVFCFRYKREREQASKLASGNGSSSSTKSRSGSRKRRSSSQDHSSGEESITDQQENLSDMFDDHDSFSQDDEMQIVEMDCTSPPLIQSTLCLTPVNRNSRHCMDSGLPISPNLPPPNQQRFFGTEKRNIVNGMSRRNYASLAPSTPPMVTPMGVSSVHNQRGRGGGNATTPSTPKSSHSSWMESPIGSRPPKPKRIWLEREQENHDDDQYFTSNMISHANQENSEINTKYLVKNENNNDVIQPERGAIISCADNQPRPSVLVMASQSPTEFEMMDTRAGGDTITQTCRNQVHDNNRRNVHQDPSLVDQYATFYSVNVDSSKSLENGRYVQNPHKLNNGDNHNNSYAIHNNNNNHNSKYDTIEMQGNSPMPRYNAYSNSHNLSSIHLTAQQI